LILVTGGRGFIGSYVVELLRNMQKTVIVLDNYSTTYPGFCKIHRGNLGLDEINDVERKHRGNAFMYRKSFFSDSTVVKSTSFELETWEHEKPELIINCGNLSEAVLSQYYNKLTFDSMVKGMKWLKKEFPGVPIIHFSSSMVYGTWNNNIKETDDCNPVDWYGTCKLMTETLLDYKKDVILRPIHVFGYGDGKFPITMNIERQVLTKKPVNIETAGCIYIHDLIMLIRKIINSYKPGIYNVSSGYIRDGEIVKQYAKSILGYDIKIHNKLGPTGKERGDLNTDNIKKTFDWQPNFRTYEKAIEHYFREYYENNSKK